MSEEKREDIEVTFGLFISVLYLDIDWIKFRYIGFIFMFCYHFPASAFGSSRKNLLF